VTAGARSAAESVGVNGAGSHPQVLAERAHPATVPALSQAPQQGPHLRGGAVQLGEGPCELSPRPQRHQRVGAGAVAGSARSNELTSSMPMLPLVPTVRAPRVRTIPGRVTSSPACARRHTTRPPAEVGAVRAHLFTNRATHSTWKVIGKAPIVLSANAILCRQLRSSEETGR